MCLFLDIDSVRGPTMSRAHLSKVCLVVVVISIGAIPLRLRVLFSLHFAHLFTYSSTSSYWVSGSAFFWPHMFYSCHDDHQGSSRGFLVKFNLKTRVFRRIRPRSFSSAPVRDSASALEFCIPGLYAI
jgi:hypothetical protein